MLIYTGFALVGDIIEEAKKKGCYKLVATSRFSRQNIHQWYEKLGFLRWDLSLD